MPDANLLAAWIGILLGSVAGRQVYPGGNVYCATKHAVRALYESLRLDLAGSGRCHPGSMIAAIEQAMLMSGRRLDAAPV